MAHLGMARPAMPVTVLSARGRSTAWPPSGGIGGARADGAINRNRQNRHGLVDDLPAQVSRSAEDGRAGVARERLRSRGAAHRPGNPRALPPSRRGAAGDVHRAGPADHPLGVPDAPRAEEACRRAREGAGGGRGNAGLRRSARGARGGLAAATATPARPAVAAESREQPTRVPESAPAHRLGCTSAPPSRTAMVASMTSIEGHRARVSKRSPG